MRTSSQMQIYSAIHLSLCILHGIKSEKELGKQKMGFFSENFPQTFLFSLNISKLSLRQKLRTLVGRQNMQSRQIAETQKIRSISPRSEEPVFSKIFCRLNEVATSSNNSFFPLRTDCCKSIHSDLLFKKFLPKRRVILTWSVICRVCDLEKDHFERSTGHYEQQPPHNVNDADNQARRDLFFPHL